MALYITYIEKLNLGSHAGVRFIADFDTAAGNGEAFVPQDVGLEDISILTCEGQFDVGSGTTRTVAYDRVNDKLVLVIDGEDSTGGSGNVVCLAIGH